MAKKAATAAKKKATAKKSRSKAMGKGSKLSCDVCGLLVSVDKECGCSEPALVCCGEEMSAKKK